MILQKGNFWLFLILGLLAACTAQPATPKLIPSAEVITTIPQVITPTSTLPPPTITPTLSMIHTPATIEVCSPLAGIALDEINEIVTNPFAKPDPGSDAGHHGVDFAYYQRGESHGIEGLPVISILDGDVAMSLSDTWPYGNVLIIETPINQLPETWQESIASITRTSAVTPDSRLFCPAGNNPNISVGDDYALYVLYAHLKEVPSMRIGTQVQCGDAIGQVGNTGYSGNPHLHLEFRIGPRGIVFDEMSHYKNTATEQEMVNYCLWRVSGVFQMIDPIPLLTLHK